MTSESDELAFLKQVEARLISVTEAAQISKLTVSYIRRLLREERLPGVKIDHNWFTTRVLLHNYLMQERRPGPG